MNPLKNLSIFVGFLRKMLKRAGFFTNWKRFNTNRVGLPRLAAVLLDSTLREGELFRVFPRETRVRLARGLVEAGVKRIELALDYPPRTTFEDNMAVIRELKGSGAQIVIHARACTEDIEALNRYDVEGCAFYIAVSRLHREHKLQGISVEDAVGRLAAAAHRAREMGFRYIRTTFEDATRVFLEEGEGALEALESAIHAVGEQGASIVSLPDTAGLLTPRLARQFFRAMRKRSRLPLAAHFHNDYGFASANTVEAALEGASELHVTIMGIGDRNGIADLYQVAAALEDVHGLNTGIDRSSLGPLYREFSRLTGIPIPWTHPLSEAARTIRAGTHQSMALKRPEGYMPPKKLVHDFDRPLYMLSPHVSSKLLHQLIAAHRGDVDRGVAREIAQELAAIIRDNPNPSPLPNLMRIVKQRLGVELPHEDLAKLFGGETVYILLRLEPRFQADKISREVLSWPGVECVDEVYGDADMVVKARVDFTRDNLITRLRQRFSEAIRDIRVLVTD